MTPKSHRNLTVSFSGTSFTRFAGLYLLQQFLEAIRFRSNLARSIRIPRRNARYTVSDLILAVVYPVILGLERIENTRVLHDDRVFLYIAGLPKYPDPTTLRRFLVELGDRALDDLRLVHDRLRALGLQRRRSVIFDLDTTVLTTYGRQQGARVGYNPKKPGRRSYQPLLCFEGKTCDLWAGKYLPGDAHPAPESLGVLEESFGKLPKTVSRVHLRADSAFYDHEIVEYLAKKRVLWAIVARATKPIQNRLGGLRYEEISPRCWLAELEYRPLRWKQSARLIVVKRPLPEEPSWQLSLFQLHGYTYRIIATNLNRAPVEVLRFYNQRCTDELIVRELLEAYMLGKIPTGQWSANEAYFELVSLSYNLLNWFKRFCLPRGWRRFRLQTIRDRILHVPGQLVRPKGRVTLKLPVDFRYQEVFHETLSNIQQLKRRVLNERRGNSYT